MTTTPAAARTAPAWRVVLLAALAALAALLLPAAPASAATVPAAGNCVGAITTQTIFTVGVHESVSAGGHRVRGPSQLQLMSGHCVAAEARTLDIGGGSFPGQDVKSIIRTPDGVISVNPNAAHGPTVVGRSQQLPFADNSFTSVTMNHFPADQLGDGTLSEVARVLRSGGDLSLTTGRVADTGAIIDELERLGFATTLGRAEGGIPWITGVLG